ncbi:MAG: methyltransferase domain-containing protein [Proteobacteria bacterium]|nr:methyltransferase domain-containing protein [Pseudomonadota bacterium]
MPKLQPMPEPNVYPAYGIYLLEPKHRSIRRLKKEYQPSVHGHKTWDSSFVLMDYLQEHPIAKGARVMEVGCGWGPASIYCARRFKAKVTGVDIDPDVFPFLDVLAELNDVKVKQRVSRFEKLKGKELGGFDVLIGSDICFWDNLVKPLYRLISRALEAGTKRVIITDPGRPTFHELCELCRGKFKVELTEWYALEPARNEGEVVEITLV